jgi:Xaa-Pro aminopeptidase
VSGRLQRLQAKVGELGLDAVVIAAPESLSSVNLRYLSGFRGSSAYLMVGARPEEAWLLTDFRYTEQAEREAPGFHVLRHERPVTVSLARIAREAGFHRMGLEADKIPAAMYWDWEREVPAEWVPMSGLVEQLRLIKDPDELDRIRQACAAADAALAEVLPTIAGRREQEVALDLEIAMRRAGAERLGFETIIASGVRGSLPHGKPTDKVIAPGELVTIDFGGYVDGYHSDETVTVGVGRVPDQLRAIWDIVHEAQARGIRAVRPGVRASDVDRACRAYITDAGYGEQFGHGTGHGVGLAIHEDPFLGVRPATDFVLEAGMTVTVEPGIYVPGLGGARLEDTLVVTRTGSEALTQFPKHWQTV